MAHKSPLIAFGLLATTVAMKAKTEKLKVSDKLQLIDMALKFSTQLPTASSAVIDFLEAVDAYPLFAADRLQDAVRDMPGQEPIGTDPSVVLKRLEGEAVLNGWASRKDCGHG